MSTRDVTYSLLRPDGTPETRRLRVELIPGDYDADAIYPRRIVYSTPDADGAGTLELWPNEGGLEGSVYECTLPSGETFEFTVPTTAGPFTLSDLRADGVTLDILAGDAWVRPESHGAVAYATKAAAHAGVDSTAALVAALATGKHVLLSPGWYSYTGGLEMNTPGQKLIGAGRGRLVDNEGTYLSKRSGTSVCVRPTQTDHYIADIHFDGNSLAGNQLYIYQNHRTVVERVSFSGQGGTDYALLLDGPSVVNVATFRDLQFFDGNYGHIKIAFAFYCSFHNVFTGTPTNADGIAIDIGATNASVINFYNLQIDDEAQLKIHGDSSEIRFYGYGSEEANARPFIYITGTSVTEIHFYGVHLFRAGASTQPFVKVEDCLGSVVFHDVMAWGQGMAAGEKIIHLNNASRFTIDGLDIAAAAALKAIFCDGTRSDDIVANRVRPVSGSTTPTSEFKCARLHVSDCVMDVTFAVGHDSALFVNHSGTFTYTNAARLEQVGAGALGVSTDRGDADVTLTAGPDEPIQRFATELSANRTITLAAGGWDGAKFRIVRTGLGAFTLDVGGLKTIPSGTAAFVDVAWFDSTGWILTGYGAL